MRSTYKTLGPYIREVVDLNNGLQVELLLGVSVSKVFIPSIANTIGTDMSRYKIVREKQFAYGPVTSRNSDKVSIALMADPECIISTSYTVFEITDEEKLLPEYLMMWFRRPEFDRYARFKSHGSVRELFGWDEMCDVELPIPSIEKQREIVKEYQTIADRIRLNERLNEKLEEAAQAIYKHWFVNFEFPMTAEYARSIGKPELSGQPYKSCGGEMEYSELLEQDIPKGWTGKRLGEVVEVTRGASPRPIDDFLCDHGVPWVKISDATASLNKHLLSTRQFIKESGVSASRCVRPGALILSNSASPGLPMFMQIDACVHDGWLLFTFYQEDLSKQILYHILVYNRRDILTSGYGSVFNNLKSQVLKDYRIPIPAPDVAEKLTRSLRRIDASQLALAKERELMGKLQRTILSGIARVRNI